MQGGTGGGIRYVKGCKIRPPPIFYWVGGSKKIYLKVNIMCIIGHSLNHLGYSDTPLPYYFSQYLDNILQINYAHALAC
jgi:hypothetical protein